MAAHHPGHRHQADILTERRVRQSAEDARDGGAEAVGEGRAPHLVIRRLPAGAALADA